VKVGAGCLGMDRMKCGPERPISETETTPSGGSGIRCTNRKMTQEQESHLQGIKDQFARDVDAKYRAGVREHGGNLWEMTPLQLIDEAMKEAVDQYTYLFEARRQVSERCLHSSDAA
jgi:hypothetical protein